MENEIKTNVLNNFLGEYEPVELRKNITELDKIFVEDIQDIKDAIYDFTVEGSDEVKKIKRYIFRIKSEEYIIPVSVMNGLKELSSVGLLKQFKVLKKGTGQATRYSVIPLEFIQQE